MKSSRPKVMHELAGRPMISWLIETAESLDPRQIIVVGGPDMPELETAVAPHTLVLQQEQNGTAHAVGTALPHMSDPGSKVLILLGDEPFVPQDALEEMISTDAPSVMALEVQDPTGLGRMILRSDGTLESIIEQADATPEQRKIKLCNAGNFCLPGPDLGRWLQLINNQNAQGEYYLTDLPKIAAEENIHFHVTEIRPATVWGINTRAQLAEHETFIQNFLRNRAMENGVTLIDPASVYFSWDTDLAEDITVEPNVVFGRGVKIDRGTRINTCTRLEGVTIGRECEIGPFAHINYPKKPSWIGDKVTIGNFVEIKRSKIEDGVKAKHLSYLADAEIGSGSNIGCGTITVNYDGYKKHQTLIGDHVMIGCNTNLIAPVTIGKDAVIAAATTVTADIPEGAMGIGRSRLEVKEGWATQRNNKNITKKKVS